VLERSSFMAASHGQIKLDRKAQTRPSRSSHPSSATSPGGSARSSARSPELPDVAKLVFAGKQRCSATGNNRQAKAVLLWRRSQ
jgi:hypothetical protein